MTVAEVQLWGKTIGAVSWNAPRRHAEFEYLSEFAGSGIEVAPLTMPLSDRIYRFPELARESFHGLPGLLADSLPDKFGNALINAWLARQGRSPESFNPVERLCYTGHRGMGALEYSPTVGPRAQQSSTVDVAALVTLAGDILNQRAEVAGSFNDRKKEQSLQQILRVGTSAGGARAKAVIAWNTTTNEVRSGQVTAGEGFTYWLLKFDGVSGNRDKELDDPAGYGLIEFAYYTMALAAGINMHTCSLLRENGRNHFMAKRFDRSDDGRKLHMQSLGAMAHLDFNQAGVHSYEQALRTIIALDMPAASVEEQFRRMVFNIAARNQDDHVKNIGFLMDRAGNWSLSPAFDVTYSYNPAGDWTGSHQMSLNGKRDHFTLDDFETCARAVSMKRGRAQAIIEEVETAVLRWMEFAADAGVPPEQAEQIRAVHRVGRRGMLAERDAPRDL